jgi:endonuclease III
MNAALAQKALIVYDLLLKTYGERPLKPRREPMHELISTMLSHRTNNANEAEAYRRMWERFGYAGRGCQNRHAGAAVLFQQARDSCRYARPPHQRAFGADRGKNVRRSRAPHFAGTAAR